MPSKKVSIPFKRESVSKGKATVNEKRQSTRVSIPFKRESVSKVRYDEAEVT